MLEDSGKRGSPNRKIGRKVGGKQSTHAGTCDVSWPSEMSLTDL